MFEFLVMAVHNLYQRKLRSGLTVLGIVIGIAAIVSLVSIGEGMRLMVTEQLRGFGANKIMVLPSMQMGMGPSMGGMYLTEKDLDDIKDTRGVDIATGMLVKTLTVNYKDEVAVLTVTGIEPEDAEKFFADVQGFEIETGRWMDTDEKYSVVIGNIAAYNLFSEDVRLKDKLEIKNTTVKVVGIMKEIGNYQDDTMVVISVETLRDLTGEEEEITMILVKVKDVEEVEEVAEEIKDDLDKTYGEKMFTAMTAQQIVEQVGSIIGIISVFLGGIAAISLLVAGIGIANTMFMSIMERTREIGIMKAIGATNRNVLMMFLTESVLIGLIGGAVGCTIGIGMSKVIDRFSSFYGIQVKTAVTFELLLIGLIFSMVVGIFSGFLPARKAAKLQPVEALRYE